MSSPSVAERARLRIREELHVRDISQRDLADLLSRATGETWTQGRVGKVLTGKVEFRIDEAAAIAAAINLSLVEVIRDRGLEFYAELAPTELRVLERIRQHPHLLDALLVLLNITPPPTSDAPKAPTRRKVGRPKNSERERAPDGLRA